MYRKKGLKQSVVIILVILLLIILTSCGRSRMRDNSENLEQTENIKSETDAQQPKINIDNILFWDNFQDGDTMGWEIASGWYTQQDDDKYWFQSVNESAAWVPKGIEWDGDYALKAVCNLQQGTLGLSFCATTDGRYVALIHDGRMSLIKETAEEAKVLAQCDGPALSTLHLITVGKKNNQLQVYVDKQLMLSVEDASPLSGGTIALGTKQGTDCTIDNVLVNKITKQLPGNKPVGVQYIGADIILPEEIGDVVSNLPEDSSGFEDLPEENVPEEVASSVVSFTIDGLDSATISNGDQVLVEWNVDDASLITYESTVVDASGSEVESPIDNTDYTLTVTDLLGRSENYTVSAVVEDQQASGGVDVLIKGVGVEKPYIKGQPLHVSVTIKNAGSEDAGAFSAAWYPKSDGVVGLSWNVDKLESGQEATLVGDYIGYPKAGNFTWQAFVDTENEVGDINKDNNKKSSDIHINPGNEQAEMPDMVLKGVGVQAPFIKGEPIPVRVTIKNNGDSGASGFKVEWFADGLGSAALTWDILILAPGIEMTLEGVYSGYSESGTYTWNAKVDRIEQIEDSNRGNNTKSNSIVVSD